MQYTINNQILSVTVDTLGAEIVSIKKNNQELLWQNQTGDWDGHAPILFPVCGNCSVNVDGIKYDMPKHGFAKTMQFELVQISEGNLELALRYNEQTLKTYPYKFEFVVKYALSNNNLEITWTVRNLDVKPLHFYCGGHEAHYLPQTIDNYQLVFENEETFNSLHFADGLLKDTFTSYGKGKVLAIPKSGLANKETVIFGNINSRKVTLQDANGKQFLTEQFDDFYHLLLWSPDCKHCLCIEPWQNLPDNLRDTSLDFSKKANAQTVAPQEHRTITRVICYH